MRLAGLHPFLSAKVAVILVGLAIAGCGAAGAEDQQSYGEVLQGLKEAARAGGAYGAISRAKGLDPAKRDVVDSFCEFAWQVGANKEGWKLSKHAYVVARIRYNAYERGNARFAPINAAMGRLNAVVDLTALSEGLLHRYSRACHN